MSRILDALKRRVAENLLDEESEVQASSVAAAAAPEDDWWAGEKDVPFIEVPSPEAQNASASGRADNPVSSGSVSSDVCDKPSIPSACRFEAAGRSQAESFPLIDPWLGICREAASTLARQLQDARLRSLVLLPVRSPPEEAALAAFGRLLQETGFAHLLLMDTRTSHEALARLLGTVSRPGITDVVAGLPLASVIQETLWSSVHFLAPGHRLALAAEAILQRLPALLHDLRQRYDLVVVVAETWLPPQLPTPLVHGTEAVVLLLDAVSDASGVGTEAVRILQAHRLPVLGSVILPTNQAAARCRGDS